MLRPRMKWRVTHTSPNAMTLWTGAFILWRVVDIVDLRRSQSHGRSPVKLNSINTEFRRRSSNWDNMTDKSSAAPDALDCSINFPFAIYLGQFVLRRSEKRLHVCNHF